MLEVNNLGIHIGVISPLSNVTFEVPQGKIVGVVGESGSGKSITAMSIMGLLPLIGGKVTSGSIRFGDTELSSLSEREYRKLRGGKIALITQNPMTSLDPLKKIGPQVDDVSILHLSYSAQQAREHTIKTLGDLRIPEPESVYHLYPHQLSGGMKQRIVIAMALVTAPDLLIADEPTTALDVTVQAQIIRQLQDLVVERNLSLMLITHDMSVIAQTCDSVVVMYAGTSVERGSVKDIFYTPKHPYTKALIDCIPKSDAPDQRMHGIKGTVPTVANYPSGCRFHPRCPSAKAICSKQTPLLTVADTGRAVACHFPLEGSK